MAFDYLKRFSAEQVCAAVAILCPILAITFAIFINLQHTVFWNELNPAGDASRMAGAMMGAAEGILLMLSLFVGCLLGVGVSFFSLARRRSKIGFVALAVNLAPTLLLLVVKIMGALLSL